MQTKWINPRRVTRADVVMRVTKMASLDRSSLVIASRGGRVISDCDLVAQLEKEIKRSRAKLTF